jgi:adenine deaminase
MEFPVREGVVDISAMDDVCLVSVVERHGRTGKRSLAPVKGLGLQQGAVASTVAHDSHNLVVLGRDPEDMARAARELVACGGGICCVRDGQVMALLPLPIAGLMSPLPLEDLVPLVQRLSQALQDLGMPFRQPIGWVVALALPVIPSYSITDLGLVDVDSQVILPIWADEV